MTEHPSRIERREHVAPSAHAESGIGNRTDEPSTRHRGNLSQSVCRIHCLGFVTVAHWIPPLGTGPGTKPGLRPRRFTFQFSHEWSWWPRPGYEQYRPWRRSL